MIIYFLRHGLAGDWSEWHDDDVLRPLTEEGNQKMARVAETIARLNLGLDLIITSPLVRAFQTAEIVTKRLNLKGKLIQDERLSPGFDRVKLEKILGEYPEVENILVVGHEPDFSQTISALIGGGRVICKKGGLARVNVTNRSPLQGELVWLVPPRLLIS